MTCSFWIHVRRLIGKAFPSYVIVYYVLKNTTCHVDVERELDYLGMLKFARDVMWIEKECLGLEDNLVLTDTDERDGKVILNEIVKGGNFGKFDERYSARK